MSLNYRQATDMPAIGTPQHNEIFKEWVRQIRDHMKEKGFSNEQWAFYWVDEPGDEQLPEVRRARLETGQGSRSDDPDLGRPPGLTEDARRRIPTRSTSTAAR